MDSKQIDTAMREQVPVVYDGVRYKRILEYVSWYDHSRRRQLSAVLLPMQGRYTVRVPAERVELLEKREGQADANGSSTD